MPVLLCLWHLKRALLNYGLKKVQLCRMLRERDCTSAERAEHTIECFCLALQVKQRALRIRLYEAVNAVIERCGTVGMDAAQLDDLVDAELRCFCDTFQDEPQAAAYVHHIMAYYAPRKRAPCALPCCIGSHTAAAG